MPDMLDLVLVILASLVAAGVVVRLFLARAAFAGTLLLLIGQAAVLLLVLPDAARRPLLLLPAAAVAIAIVVAGARLLAGRQQLALVAIAATLPLRVPLELAGERYNLLVPLYLVLAVAGVRLALDDLRQPPATAPRAARALDIGIAAIVVLACMSVSWSVDVDASAQKIAFVYAPFALLYVLVRSWLVEGRVGVPAAVFTGVLTLAGAVGIVQHATRTIWQNPKVEVANIYAPNFRTNSIFWDPNIYGRYLVAALLLLATWMLVTRRPSRGALAAAGGAAAILAVGLWYSYSQSSFVALAGGTLVLAAVTLPSRTRALLALLLVLGTLALPTLADELRGRDANARRDVAARGLVLAAERPVQGLGVGAFEHGVRTLARDRGEELPRQLASHTTPITILAELGVLGASSWLLVLTAAGALAVSGASRARRVVFAGEPGGSPAVRWAAGATLAAVTAHSMFYAGFFEDPLTWACCGALAATAHQLRDNSPAA